MHHADPSCLRGFYCTTYDCSIITVIPPKKWPNTIYIDDKKCLFKVKEKVVVMESR